MNRIPSFLYKIYTLVPKPVVIPYFFPVKYLLRAEYFSVAAPSVVPSPGFSLILLQNFFNLVPFITYSMIGVPAIIMFIKPLKEFFNLQTKTGEFE